ncbi:demethylmenaquinone methyltransferase-like isoform X5 [Eriocheir sinensis]|uniref:demethylmenaquinone methyltransferase-like isoform X3 n=2 Tax=Eriocheir sinensis TaxID=95602 RepID=UPI0021C70334|nr:demethylmenaquinone methyltransferase-like isoform X3 [Eriocheir sinensis]XP_050724483.1 demethylmenaquinone methyltransferase-like isoform X3 [Eriocheir sinensis]XP_050724485.1 demethylmenaquinone methyltransferase-like isoform X4 [Eriocheir sinensis]XP_050724486.1 demethylmenaquinone methyltransferase-like isoform X5 [Eriocheir sinensis]
MYKGIVMYCSHALPVILPSLPCCRIMSEGGSRGDVAMRANENVHRSGVTPEEMAAGYDEWSENYEEMMIWKGGYRGPAITLEEALRWVPPERRAKARVLDVAAGTGCVGRELHREGFSHSHRHIDAVDPSEGMMKQRETGIYTNDFLEFIGSGHSTVPKDTYDLVVTSGGMGEGHIPLSGLDDLVRVAKNGGFVIIVMRHEHLQTVPSYKDKLEPYMDQLEADGKWKKVERRTVPNYFCDKEGLVFVFRITKPE